MQFRNATVLLLCLVASSAAAQRIPTRCEVQSIQIDDLTTDLRLVACGEQYQDNVLWHLDRADSPSGALDGSSLRPATGKGVVVYVYDSGIRTDHDEFARPGGTNVIGAIDPARDLGLPNDPCTSGVSTATDPCRDTDAVAFHWLYTHGTAVASVIAGRHTGVAPDASLVAVAALKLASSVYLEALDGIIRHAWESGASPLRTSIVNMSTAIAPAHASLITAMETKMRDMIFGVDAAGNRDPNGKRFLFVGIAGNYLAEPSGELYGHCDAAKRVAMFPSTLGTAIDGLIVVGGITPANQLWDRSCIGAEVDILAPASDMLVASLTGRDHYRSGHLVFGVPGNSGTSYSAPYVSGLAALLLEKYGDLSPEDLERRIKTTASRVDDLTETTGDGRVATFERPPAGPRRRAVRR